MANLRANKSSRSAMQQRENAKSAAAVQSTGSPQMVKQQKENAENVAGS